MIFTKEMPIFPKTKVSVFVTEIISILCEVGIDVKCTVKINFSPQTLNQNNS